MNREYNQEKKMEEIFYATLALYVAGKPINKENIQIVLKAAGTPVDETSLDAMAAFVESLEATRHEKERPVDPRIVKFLTSELAQRKMQTEQLGTLLEELTRSISEAPHEATTPPKISASAAEEEAPVASEEVSPEEAPGEEAGVVVEAPGGAVAPQRTMAKPSVEAPGRYVYGIAAAGVTESLGQIGIEGAEVYTIPYQNLCAIVHNCPAEPYQSKDDEIVKNWARAHQGVLDKANEQLGTIIPLGFDTVLQSKVDVTSPDQVVKDWLKEDYERLCTVTEKIKGKDEYGVQVFYDPQVAREIIAQQSEEIKKIKEEMATKSPGMAYMYRQKLEKAARAEMDRLAAEWFKDFYSRIRRNSDDIVVEKVKKAEKDKVMLLNLSCLVAKERAERLGEELERIDNMEGFSVRFTGPWPPYSFVAKPVSTTEEE